MGRPKLTEQEIIKQVECLGLEFIKFIKYDGKLSEFIVKCEKCCTEYKTTLNILKKGRNALGCPTCKYLNKIKTNIDKVGFNKVKEYCNSMGFELLSLETEYNGIKSNINVKCPNNHIIKISYTNLKKRVKKCSECIKQEKYNDALNRAKFLNYTLLSKFYNGKMDKLDIICDKGHLWNPTYDSFVYAKTKCLHCQYSKGETRIENYLTDNSIEYIKQYCFDDCIYKRRLKFDFYLPDYNICIEYDGVQHFEPQEHFGGIDTYEDLVIKDNIKNKYCQKNNIKLIRIDYMNFENIENILIKELNLK